MSIRSGIAAIFRFIVLTIAWIAVIVAGLYVLIANPLGTWGIARIAEWQVATRTDITLQIGSFNTDYVSYIKLANTRVALPDDTTRISIDQFHVRYSIVDLVRGELGGINRVQIDNLNMAFRTGGESEPTGEPFEWSIQPYLAFVPQRIAIDGLRLALIGEGGSTEFALPRALITTTASAEDSSLTGEISLAAELPGVAAVSTIPLTVDASILLRGPATHVDRLTLSAPGANLSATAEITDVIGGPYASQFHLNLDLAELPSDIAQLDLAGVVVASGSVTWSDTPEIDFTMLSDAIATPWVVANDFRLDAATDSAGRIVIDGASHVLDGALALDASLPLIGDDRSFSVAIRLSDADVAELARIPGLNASLAPMDLSGKITLNAHTHGVFGHASGGIIPADFARVDLSATELVFAETRIGDATLRAEIRGAAVETRAEAAGAVVEMSGRMPSVKAVDLVASLRIGNLEDTLQRFGVHGVGGAITADAEVSGALATPTAQLRAEFTEPILPSIRIETLTLDASLDRGDVLRTSIATADSLIYGSARLDHGLTFIDSLNLSIGPWPISNLPGGLRDAFGLAGSFTIDATGSGPFSAPRISAKLRTTEITLRETSLGSFVANVDYNTNAITFDMQNDLNTLDITGTVSPTRAALSSIALQWQAFEFGAILAAFTGQPVEDVAGVSEGSVSVTWRDPIAETLRVAARVEQVSVDFIGTTYELANPPARFDYADRALSLEPVLLSGDGQSLRVHGSVTRDGAIDFSMSMDDLSIGTLVSLSAGDDMGASGTIAYQIDLGGTITHPAGNGFIRAENIRWRSFAVDSIGAQIVLKSDTLRIPDLHARFPFGQLDGSVMATLNAMGVPVPSKIEPVFNIDLDFDGIGVHIPQWDGLRGGNISLTGAFDMTGAELSNLGSYRGSLRIDTLAVEAPFERSLVLVEPFVLRIARDDTMLSSPIRLAQITGVDTIGTVTISHRPDSASLGLDLDIERFQLADLRRLVMPLTYVTGISLPEDLSGELFLSATWNMETDEPQARLRTHLHAPTGYGVQADSIRFLASVDPERAVIEEGYLFSSADTLHMTGGISFVDDTLAFRAYADHMEMIRIALPSLPPIDDIVMAAAPPTTVPMPGATQHLQYLPQSMSGEEISRARTVFDRLVSEGTLRRPDYDFAATIPVDLDVRLNGPTASPELDGFVRLLGGYIDLRALDQPLWFTDSLEIPLDAREINIEGFRLHIGGTDQIHLRQAVYSLDDGSFDFHVDLDRVKFGVISTERVVLPWYLRPFGFLLKPLLEVYSTDRVGTFTLDSEIRWRGTRESSSLIGDVAFYNSVVEYPMPEPQELFAPRPGAGGGGGDTGEFMPGVDILINLTTPDSIKIDNNVSNNASLGFTLQFTGMGESPRLQGRMDVSPGSAFRYFNREFIVNQGSVVFHDPLVFNPVIELEATSTFLGIEQSTTYRVVITVTGTYPDRMKTEFVAYIGTGAMEEVIVDQRQVITLLLFGTTEVQLQAQDRFNRFLANQGYIVASAALGSMIPLDQVTVQQRDTEIGDTQESTVTELEVAETFRVFGQRVRVSVATPINEISTGKYQRAEARWYILQRPEAWPNLESLSLTAGTAMVSDYGVQQVVEGKEWTTDVQVRIRF